MSAAVQTATGTGHTGQNKSFFGVGESTRGGGAVFTKKRPSPSRHCCCLEGEKKGQVSKFCSFALLHLSDCARNHL